LKRTLLLLLGVTILVLLFAGCGGGGGTVATGTQVKGLVTDTAGQPLGGVTITAGSYTTTTLSDGTYTLPCAAAANMKVTATKAEHVATFEVVTIAAGQTVPLNFTLGEVGHATTLSSMIGSQGVANDGRGGAVTLPASSVQDSTGTLVHTAVVEVTTVQPNDTNFAESFPGQFVGSGLTGTTGEVAIESFGYMNVDITSGGKECDLAPGKTAEIAIPVASGSDPGTATIPLWSLNEATGKWEYVKDATRDASGATVVYRATVSHFSTYNLDRPIANAMPLTVTVQQGTTPVAGASVVVSIGADAGSAWEGRDVTGPDGTVTFPSIPPGSVRKAVAVKGDLKGSGSFYQVDNGKATMSITIAKVSTKVITFYRMVGGVKTPVSGVSVMAMSEGAGGGGGHMFGTTGADGKVSLEFSESMNMYVVSGSKTIDGVSYSGYANVNAFVDIPSEIEMKTGTP
jgi:hypothetical protein